MQLLRLWWDFSTVWIWKGKWKKSWEEISDIRCRELEELNWYSSSEKSEVTCRNFSLLVTTERPQASLVTIPGGFFNDINYFWWSTLNWELNINVYSDTWQRRFVSIRLLHNSTSNWAAVSLSKVATVVTELSLSLNSHLVKIVRAESVNERSFPDCSISQGDQSEGVGGDHLAPVHRHPHSLTSQLWLTQEGSARTAVTWSLQPITGRPPTIHSYYRSKAQQAQCVQCQDCQDILI